MLGPAHDHAEQQRDCRFRGPARPSIRRAPRSLHSPPGLELDCAKAAALPAWRSLHQASYAYEAKTKAPENSIPSRCTQSRRAARYREGNRTWLHASGAPGAQASERRLLAAGDRVKAADQRGSGPHACEQCEAKFELPAAKFELPSIRGSPFLRCSWQASYLLVHTFIVHTPKAGRFCRFQCMDKSVCFP
jgi:hypothetical protein